MTFSRLGPERKCRDGAAEHSIVRLIQAPLQVGFHLGQIGQTIVFDVEIVRPGGQLHIFEGVFLAL